MQGVRYAEVSNLYSSEFLAVSLESFTLTYLEFSRRRLCSWLSDSLALLSWAHAQHSGLVNLELSCWEGSTALINAGCGQISCGFAHRFLTREIPLCASELLPLIAVLKGHSYLPKMTFIQGSGCTTWTFELAGYWQNISNQSLLEKGLIVIIVFIFVVTESNTPDRAAGSLCRMHKRNRQRSPHKSKMQLYSSSHYQ